MNENKDAALARRLMRSAATVSLATWLPQNAGGGGASGAGGTPYVSLSTVACDLDGRPLLLMSELAEHSRNVAADNRVALLFIDSRQRPDPLAGARLTAMGRLERSIDADQRRRFLARHPAAERYAGFADFAIFRLQLERAHLVAGFGRVAWFEADTLLLATGAGLAADEEALVAELNAWPAAELAALAGREPNAEPWQASGCDPEGIDLRAAGQIARHDFRRPLGDAGAIRRALARRRQKKPVGDRQIEPYRLRRCRAAQYFLFFGRRAGVTRAAPAIPLFRTDQSRSFFGATRGSWTSHIRPRQSWHP